MTEQSCDILIAGGGLTGAALMLALKNTGLKILMTEAKPFSEKMEAGFDARTLALSPASLRILDNLNLWKDIAPFATPIKTIEVSRQFKFGRTRLHSEDLGFLGSIVELRVLHQVFFSRLAANTLLVPSQITAWDKNTNKLTLKHQDELQTILPKLVIAADGTHSALRALAGLEVKTRNYQQQAIVANIGLGRGHANVAYERFTSDGPLALLPMQANRAALVWALSSGEADKLANTPEAEFLQHLQKAFGYQLGKFIRVGKRVLFPLTQAYMPKIHAWPLVFIGNAAQTLHPVAGQGFNLGLRDVASLAQCIDEKGLSSDMLETYASRRHADQRSILDLTDNLLNFFTNQLPGFGLLQSLSLLAMDNSLALQKRLVRKAKGFDGYLPDLVLKEGHLHETV